MSRRAGPPADPQAGPLGRAEDAVLAEIGPRLRRWTDVESFVDRVVSGPAWADRFPTAPLEVSVVRRSRSATASLAVPATSTIAIRDGHWFPLVVLHELAHLVTPSPPPHGPRFAANELELVRLVCGIEAAAALRLSFTDHGVAVEG